MSLKISITSSLTATKGVVTQDNISLFNDDNVKITNEGATILEFSVKDIGKNFMAIDLKKLLGNKVEKGGDSILIKRL